MTLDLHNHFRASGDAPENAPAETTEKNAKKREDANLHVQMVNTHFDPRLVDEVLQDKNNARKRKNPSLLDSSSVENEERYDCYSICDQKLASYWLKISTRIMDLYTYYY